MEAVAVLTDSTAGLEAGLAERWGVGVIPLAVLDATGEPVASSAQEVVQAVSSGALLSTSQPSHQDFLSAYQRALDGGASAVVSVHISSLLSGTLAAAERAAAEFDGRVQVVDSRTVGGALAMSALAGARLAQRGASPHLVRAAARDVAARSLLYFAVDDLGHLHRGGRIGGASALVGSALGVRPVLTVTNGKIAVREVVRGRGRSLRHLAEHLAHAAGASRKIPRVSPGPVRICLQHVGAPEATEQVQQMLEGLLEGSDANVVEILHADCGPVLAAHAGPGAVAGSVTPVPAGELR
ncbi:MAG: DegV family protein [Buchananella hordeovulneris]|nr:DegV family protein [Buchananella hordeovulneris]